MNIIDSTKHLLQSFPRISEVCNEIHVDFTDSEPASYGLSSVGDMLISEDVICNQTRQHNFILYASFSSLNDFERQDNSEALTELSVWLGQQKDAEIETTIGEDTYLGKITGITAENGMLIEIPEGNEYGAWRYQLQILVQYTVEN